jgi:ADP-ribose pyrophosphatase YjhB (NUDIX family)
MMDIRIDSEQGKFKFRVCGILKVNEKYLTVKLEGNDFYCLPGGHVELGEDTDHAVLREMKEELGYEVKIDRLVSIVQNFFKTKDGKIFHELGYYYIVEPKDIRDVNLDDYVLMENDCIEDSKNYFASISIHEEQRGDDVSYYPCVVTSESLLGSNAHLLYLIEQVIVNLSSDNSYFSFDREHKDNIRILGNERNIVIRILSLCGIEI